jgi:hypothetical protein
MAKALKKKTMISDVPVKHEEVNNMFAQCTPPHTLVYLG